MRAFSFPLAYAPWAEAEIERMVRAIAVDIALRSDPELVPLAGLPVDESFDRQHGTGLLYLVEHDGRRTADVCRKCGLDRQRAEFYDAACYPIEGYSDDGLHYPPPAEAHEWESPTKPLPIGARAP